MNDGTLKIEKVTPIESKKPATLATHTVSYVLDGFQITTTLETSASITDVIARLKQLGATPPNANRQSPAPSADEAPKCRTHHSKMKQGRKGWFCPRKIEDGEYCRETA